MKKMGKLCLVLACLGSFLFFTAYGPCVALAAKKSVNAVKKSEFMSDIKKANDSFDVGKMGDVTGYDPNNPIIPTGDTIKIGIISPISGPAASIGENWFNLIQFAAHDYNNRGGIWIDGKKKLIQVIRADSMSKLDQAKKVAERLVLQDKVHILIGGESTPIMKVIQATADKYKIIAHNFGAISDEMMDSNNFNRNTFQTVYSTNQIGESLAYYFGQIRKKEKTFYILCQDYSYGHSVAASFKSGLKKYYPEAKIVGEDFHKLFLTDFSSYLTKIKTSGAEVIVTGDWVPDLQNLIKQAREYGIDIPFAGRDMENPNLLLALGIKSSRGLISMNEYNKTNPMFKTDQEKKFHEIWTHLKATWTKPYDAELYAYPEQIMGHTLMQMYWLLSVIERAKSTDPEKIIKIWENDTYRTVNGKLLMMRACDHKVVQDLSVIELVPPEQQKISYNIPPYYWSKQYSFTGPSYPIPAAKVLPWMDQKLDRCAGKNEWGE